MVMVTLQEAKAKLNQLVEKALAGEVVVLMRGAQIVAMIRPISADDLEVAPQLADTQAKRFWEEVGKEKKRSFSSPRKAVEALKRTPDRS